MKQHDYCLRCIFFFSFSLHLSQAEASAALISFFFLLCMCVCTLHCKFLLVKEELKKSTSLYLDQKLVTSEVMQHTKLQCTDRRAVSYPGSKYV